VEHRDQRDARSEVLAPFEKGEKEKYERGREDDFEGKENAFVSPDLVDAESYKTRLHSEREDAKLFFELLRGTVGKVPGGWEGPVVAASLVGLSHVEGYETMKGLGRLWGPGSCCSQVVVKCPDPPRSHDR